MPNGQLVTVYKQYYTSSVFGKILQGFTVWNDVFGLHSLLLLAVSSSAAGLLSTPLQVSCSYIAVQRTVATASKCVVRFSVQTVLV
jgi:hypothetical protein